MTPPSHNSLLKKPKFSRALWASSFLACVAFFVERAAFLRARVARVSARLRVARAGLL